MPDAHSDAVLVMLPCRNEQGRVGAVIRQVRAALPQAAVAAINDESSDDTAREAAEAGALVLPHATNLGYGAALETGYLYAVRHGYTAVLQMDGDGQHLAEELPTLLAPILDGSCDLVIGSRYLGGGKRYPVAALRRMGQRLFSLLLWLLIRRRITDPTSGFQALGPRGLRLFASGVFPCDYPDADVVMMAHLAGLRVCEVPVRMAPRAGGTSMHAGLKPLYYGIRMFLAMFIVLLNYGVWRRWRAELAAVPLAR